MRLHDLFENSIDYEYYLSEGCGAFAYALWLSSGSPSDGTISIISNNDGEPWEDIPFEATHAYYDSPRGPTDVRGVRSVDDMADEFHLHSWSVEGPYLPDHFLRDFCGMGDDKPLYCSPQMIRDAALIIRSNPELYGI